jgi:putative transposase
MSSVTSSCKEKRNYKFRIYPNKRQEHKLTSWLETCRIVYNSALADRKNHFIRTGNGLTRIAQQVILKTDKTKYPRIKEVHSQVTQEVLFRIERAFNNFFRRAKAGEKPGYPRYKGPGQYKTLTFTQFGDGLGASFKNSKLKLSKIGLVKIKLHREIHSKVKTCSIKREQSGKWYAILTVEESPVLYSPNRQSIGLDVGIKEFAVFSNGKKITNPKNLQRSERKLKTLQRNLSRKKKGSKNRAKARVKLARQHEKVRNQRQDFQHKLSTRLVWKYGTIVVEDLQIKNMVKNHRLAKNISDVGWGEFIAMLSYKAESAGRILAKVSPHGTTQECSRCGNVVPKDLSVRTHDCPYCGLVMDRDHNAAINILHRYKAS